MAGFASELIDALGGVSITSQLTDAPPSTVVRMRKNPTSARLNHLCRVAHMERPFIDLSALAARHGVTLPIMTIAAAASSGKSDEVSSGADA